MEKDSVAATSFVIGFVLGLLCLSVGWRLSTMNRIEQGYFQHKEKIYKIILYDELTNPEPNDIEKEQK